MLFCWVSPNNMITFAVFFQWVYEISDQRHGLPLIRSEALQSEGNVSQILPNFCWLRKTCPRDDQSQFNGFVSVEKTSAEEQDWTFLDIFSTYCVWVTSLDIFKESCKHFFTLLCRQNRLFFMGRVINLHLWSGQQKQVTLTRCLLCLNMWFVAWSKIGPPWGSWYWTRRLFSCERL